VEFEAGARLCFDSFAAERGLAFTRANGTTALYEGNGVQLLIAWWSWRSGALQVTVSIAGPDAANRQIRLDEILRIRCPEEAQRVERYEAAGGEPLLTGLKLLAALTDEHAGDILGGDLAAFSQIEADAQLRQKTLSENYALHAARNHANEAWRAGRYADVVASLNPFEQELSAAETKRLQIARARMR
jgi:hypothetical protein